MTDSTATIQGLRDRLTGLLADWGAELASVLKELEEKRARVAELEGGAAGRSDEIEQLKQRIDGQNTLIEALRGDAEEASKLRAEVRTKDLEFERVSSELESKKELVRALRRDTDGADRFKRKRGTRTARSRSSRPSSSARSAKPPKRPSSSLRSARRPPARQARSNRELEALRSELEARKTLIKSLRSDQERIAPLQASLDEKRQIIEQLESSINGTRTRSPSCGAASRRGSASIKPERRQPDGDDVGEPTVALRHGRARHRAARQGRRRQERGHDRDRHAALAARGASYGGQGLREVSAAPFPGRAPAGGGKQTVSQTRKLKRRPSPFAARGASSRSCRTYVQPLL